MPILRELISRFSFDVDKRSVKKFDSTIGSMKKSIVKLGAVLGIALGGKALFDMAKSATQVEANLKKVAGVKFDDVTNSIEKVSLKLEKIQKGAGLLVKGKVGQIAGVTFIRDFDKDVEKLKEFETLLEASAIQALLLGESVGSIFTGLLQAAKVGDLVSGLRGFGKLDVAKLKLTQEVLDLAVSDLPGGAPRRALFTRATLDLLASVAAEQQRRFAAADPTLTPIRLTEEKLRVEAEEKTKAALEASVKATIALVEFTQKSMEKSQKDFIKSAEIFFLDPQRTAADIKEDQELLKKKREEIKAEERARTRIPTPAGGGTINRGEFKVIEMKNIFTINDATDPKKVAIEVRKELSNVIQDASNQLIPSEDRN